MARPDRILVTRGREGLTLYSSDEGDRPGVGIGEHMGVRTRDFFPEQQVGAADTTGAGDRLLSAVVSRLTHGQRIERALPGAMREVERALKEGCL